MKLIIQIPCFNEERTLAQVFEKMPKEIEGIDELEFQIIDDCSTDQTVKIARDLGIHHIVQIKGRNRKWLGRAFQMGVESALNNGADILVNTDGDNQYPSERIPDLIKPILEEKADIVIGDRNPTAITEFSPVKRFLQGLGSKTVEFVTKETVKDAVSGFRAYSKESLLEINIITNYTYTVDTLVQALKKGLVVDWLPIQTNPKTRESRLISSTFSKIRKSGSTILRLSTIYQPFKTYACLSALFLLPGFFLLLRYLYFFFFIEGGSSGHLQSIIAGCILIVIGFMLIMMGILGDLLSANRQLTDRLLTRLRKLERKLDQEEAESKPAMRRSA